MFDKGTHHQPCCRQPRRLWNIYEIWSQFSHGDSHWGTHAFLAVFCKTLWYNWRNLFNNRHVTWNWKIYSGNNLLSFQTWILQACPFCPLCGWPHRQPLTSFREQHTLVPCGWRKTFCLRHKAFSNNNMLCNIFKEKENMRTRKHI